MRSDAGLHELRKHLAAQCSVNAGRVNRTQARYAAAATPQRDRIALDGFIESVQHGLESVIAGGKPIAGRLETAASGWRGRGEVSADELVRHPDRRSGRNIATFDPQQP